MKIGIIGNGEDKFSQGAAIRAMQIIRDILNGAIDQSLCAEEVVVVSGRSPVGGVDIWAEALATEMGCNLDIRAPRFHRWSGLGGYKERNLEIAARSDVVHVIVVTDYPEGYAGMRFDGCYHCGDRNPQHVKSGACWTAWKAHEMGKKTIWHLV